MKKISGDTVLVAIPSDCWETPARRISRLLFIIPPYMKEYFNENMEVHQSGANTVIMLSNQRQSSEMLCGIITNWLQDVCINEGCNAWDERFFIQILEELEPRIIDRDMLHLLKGQISKHVAHAQKNFGGNMNFLNQSNCEFVSTIVSGEN